MRLTNNRTKKPKKSDHSQKRREGDDKNAVASVRILSRMGCVSQDSELLVSQRGKQALGNPMQKVLGPIRRVRFTQSTLCQASIRGKKGFYHWTSGPKNHISPKMARGLIAIFQTVYHSCSLVYRRVPLQRPHLLLRHLHHRSLYLTSADTSKIQFSNEVEV